MREVIASRDASREAATELSLGRKPQESIANSSRQPRRGGREVDSETILPCERSLRAETPAAKRRQSLAWGVSPRNPLRIQVVSPGGAAEKLIQKRHCHARGHCEPRRQPRSGDRA